MPDDVAGPARRMGEHLFGWWLGSSSQKSAERNVKVTSVVRAAGSEVAQIGDEHQPRRVAVKGHDGAPTASGRSPMMS